MSGEKAKKAFGIASKVFSWIIIAITVFMMVFTIFSTLTFDRNDRNLFGIRFYVVLTDSMSLSDKNANDEVHLDAGDIVLIKNVEDARELETGDVIAFVSQNSESYGETVTHMIREPRYSTDGKLLGYVTYGTNTGTDDEALVEPEYVIGEYAGKLPGVGHFFQFLKTTPGYIVCILIPFLILILYQGVSTIRLFRRYKQEQMADMEEERAKIAEERQTAAEMMKELQALREQLAQGMATQAQPATPAPTAESSNDDDTANATSAESEDSEGAMPDADCDTEDNNSEN